MTGVRLAANERLDDLRHLGRRVIQRTDAFRFGLDAVLLARFPRYRRDCRVMELGTGTGVIPLLIAGQTGPIEALELDAEMAAMAARSVRLNGLEDAIRVRRGDYREIRTLYPPERFDLVLANPPYGGASEGARAKGARAAARQELTATLDDTVRAARYLLRCRGRFAMIHRPARLAEIFVSLSAHRLAPKRMRFVAPRAGRAPNLVLVEAVQGGAPGGLCVLPTLYVYGAEGGYTRELLTLYGEG